MITSSRDLSLFGLGGTFGIFIGILAKMLLNEGNAHPQVAAIETQPVTNNTSLLEVNLSCIISPIIAYLALF